MAEIRRAHRGQRFRIAASDWNLVAQGAEKALGSRLGGDSPALPPPFVWVRNDSANDLERGEVLGLDSLLIGLSDNEAEYKRHAVFSGILPAEPDHVGKFGVALDAVPQGRIGRFLVDGLALARVAVRADGFGAIGDQFADIQHGTHRLRSGSAGAARILAAEPVEGGSDDDWCWVKLGVTDGGGFEMAQIQAVDATTLSCKWLDGTGAPMGSAFDVNVYSYTDEDNNVGFVPLDEDPPVVYPTFAVGQPIRVYRQPRVDWNGIAWVDGYWAVDRVDRRCPPTA